MIEEESPRDIGKNAKMIIIITFGLIGLLILINGLVFGWDKNGFFHLGLDFTNPPCFYYVSDYKIKLYGINSSENHSVFVADIPGAEPIIFDRITDPPTKIPLCIK